MDHSPDYRVHDLLRLRPALRGDLVFTPCGGGIPYYRVEDPLRGKFYRVGLAEYALISLLDGRRTLEEVLRETAAVLNEEAFTTMETAAVVRWLHEAQLLETRGATGEATRPAAQAVTSRLARNNPLVARIPLVHPQDWFVRLARVGHWLFHPWFVVCWGVLVSAAVASLLAQHERLAAGGREVFYLDRGLWLGACWLALKLIHETAHGLACTRYGGRVRQAGVILVLFVPMAYVDVTSSWRFSSTWQRVAVATAGMYVELMVAAVAALTWSVSSPGALSDLCFNVLFMAGVSTLLFNANPLMRFDGYYILSDLVGLPNLAGLGRMAVADLARRGLLGVPSRGLHLTRRARLLVTAYGLAAWCWSLLVAAGLIMGAALLFHGAGIVLAAAGAMLWWGLPLGRTCRGLMRRGDLSAEHRWRGVGRLAAAAIVVAILLFGLPAPWLQRTPALVEYAPLTILRAQAPGLVSRVYVVSGQRVESGQVLVELDNEQLHQEVLDLDLALQQSDGRLRTLRNREQLAALEAELAEHKNLTDRREEKRREAAHLKVVAPCPGQVLTPHPEQLVGTYADIGRELVALGDEDHKELVLSIDQEDIASFQNSLAQPVSARVRGLDRQSGVLYRVAPAASTRPPSEAFCASAGGPVPVTTENRTEDGGKLSVPVFIQPRFEAAVQLTVEQSRQLHAGQRATVWPATRGPALAVSAYRSVRGWWRAHGKT